MGDKRVVVYGLSNGAIFVPFLRYSASNNGVPLKSGVPSFKIIENGFSFDRSHTTSCQSVIVSIALSCYIFDFELLPVSFEALARRIPLGPGV